MQFGVGRRFYESAWSAWRRGGPSGMDALVVCGTTAAYAYSAAVMVARSWFGEDGGGLCRTIFDTGAMLLTFIFGESGWRCERRDEPRTLSKP